MQNGLMDWNRLDHAQSQDILQHIAQATDPSLFSTSSSEAKFKPLSFYRDYMVYRVTNYATLPSFSLDFLSDGESFHLLDGSPSPITQVNAKGMLELTEGTVIDYVDFYFTHIRAEGSEIYLIRDLDHAPFWDSLAHDQQNQLRHHFNPPHLSTTDGGFVIEANLFYDGSLLGAAIHVTKGGEIDIRPQHLMINAPYDFGEAQE